LIHEIFHKEEAEEICSLAVCPIRNKDHRAWAGNASGEYSVKSGYHLAKERFVVEEGCCSNQQAIKVEWKNIWGIRGSRVVKIFLWKACRYILPSKEHLFRKHVTTEPLCPICKLFPETIDHILWSCSSARDVWTECSSKLQKCTSDVSEFRDIIIKLSERLSMEEMHEMVTVARLIWLSLRRNKFMY
jgi:hypothetical protein